MGRAARLKRERKQVQNMMLEEFLQTLKKDGEIQKKRIAAMDDWSDLDQAYFTENPDQKSYKRPLTPNEWKEVERLKSLGIPDAPRIYEVQVEKTTDGKIWKTFMVDKFFNE